MITPERELDAKIAKFMGVEVEKDQITYGGWLGVKKSDDPWGYFIGGTNNPILDYSTDIAAAWEVKNRFTNWIECNLFTKTLYKQVKDRLGGELSELYLIMHVTPKDICLAALAVESGEVSKDGQR